MTRNFYEIEQAIKNVDYLIVNGIVCNAYYDYQYDVAIFEKDIFEFLEIEIPETVTFEENRVGEDEIVYTSDKIEIVCVGKPNPNKIKYPPRFDSDVLIKAISKEIVYEIDNLMAIGIDTALLDTSEGTGYILHHSCGDCREALKNIKYSTSAKEQHHPAFILNNKDNSKIHMGVISSSGEIVHINPTEITKMVTDDTKKELHKLIKSFKKAKGRAEKRILREV